MTNRLDRTRARLSPDVAGIAAAIVVAVAIGASLVGRAGYGPDEEITLFAVEGIKTNIAALLAILKSDAFRSGNVHTQLAQEVLTHGNVR